MKILTTKYAKYAKLERVGFFRVFRVFRGLNSPRFCSVSAYPLAWFLRIVVSLAIIPPLPEGEGRGEWEAIKRPASQGCFAVRLLCSLFCALLWPKMPVLFPWHPCSSVFIRG